jgi:serine/threonine-protein kinase
LGEPVDARTDIFSLGIVLYQLVAAVRPFDGPDTKTTAHRIRHSEPNSLGSSTPEVPRALERVVMRCIEKLPGDRFASARELVSALEALLSAETTTPTDEIIESELLRAKVISEARLRRRASSLSLVIDPARAPLWPAVRAFLALLLLAVLGGVAIQMQAGKTEADASGKKGPLELVPARAGFLRVVARPWAEVVVDGQRIDVTPFARPIPLAGGTHYVTLKHPKAIDERRVIRVTPGETVMLDVTMGVKGMLPGDAGADRYPLRESVESFDAGAAAL